MKQFLIALLLVGFFAAPAIGQKLNSKTYSPKLMRLPAKPLEGDFKTYSVAFNGEGANLTSYNLTRSGLAQQFKLQNFERKDYAGDFEVRILVGPYIGISKSRKTKKVKGGTKEKPTETTVYFYEVTYNVPISYQLLDGARNVMREGIIYGDDPQTYQTGTNKTAKGLLENWRSRGAKEARGKVRGRIQSGVKALNSRLANQVDTGRYPSSAVVYTIKKAEKFDVEYLDKLQAKTKLAVESFNANGNDTEFEAAMNGAIEKWTGSMNKYSPNDKKQKEIFFAHAYNAAVAYYLVGDLDKAEAMLTKAEASGKRDAVIKGVRRRITSERERIAANQDVENKYVGTYNGDGAAPAPEAPAEAEPTEFIEGFVVTNGGNKVSGVITRRPSDPKAEKAYSLIIGTTGPDGKTQDRIMKLSQVKTANFNGKDFMVVPVVTEGGTDHALVEVIESKNDVNLYRQTLANDGSDMSGYPAYFLQAKGSEDVHNLQAGDWTDTSKAAMKMFGTKCATVSTKAGAGKYEADEESYRTLVSDLSGCE